MIPMLICYLLNRGSNVDMLISITNFPRRNLQVGPMALRLSYLPFRAMAETTRFLFRYGGVKYQDEVPFQSIALPETNNIASEN